MSSTISINNNEKEREIRENGSVTLDFGTRGIRSLSVTSGTVNISGKFLGELLVFCLSVYGPA